MKESVMMRIIFLVLLFFSLSSAQWECGIKGGMTAAKQSWYYNIPEIGFKKTDNYDFRYGLNAGIFLEYIQSKHLSLVGDFFYAQKGMHAKITQTMIANNEQGYTEQLVEYDNRIDIAGVSLSAKFRYDVNQFTPYVSGGARYEFLLQKKTSSFFERAYERYDDNIFGFVFGLGTELREMLPIPVLMEAIYNYDITKVKINESLKIRNSSYALKLGIKL